MELNRNRKFAMGGALYMIAGIAMLAGCKPKETNVVVAPPAPSNTTVVAGAQTKAAPTAGQEVAEVKAMITEMRTIKSGSQLPEYFTNESAAGMGIVMMIPIALMAGLEDMGGQMAGELSKLGGSSGGPSSPAPNQGPKIKDDLEATLKKYGLSQETKPDDKKAMAAVTGRGREFFRDMMLLMEKLDQKGSSGFSMDSDKAPNPDEATYEVISPTRVKVKLKSPKDKTMEDLEARFEDGRWRLHMGNIDEMLSEMKSGMGAGMPGAGSGPMPGGVNPR